MFSDIAAFTYLLMYSHLVDYYCCYIWAVYVLYTHYTVIIQQYDYIIEIKDNTMT